MANHEVSLNGSRPVPVGNVDIEAIVRRDGRALARIVHETGAAPMVGAA